MKNTGGPAFPSLRENNNPAMPLIAGAEGMTLRDYFAANASITFEDVCRILEITGEKKATMGRIIEQLSVAKYMYADAMIAERDKESEVK